MWAFGNFGLLGFALVAAGIAVVLSAGPGSLSRTGRPMLTAVGVFFLVRGLPFEQEFGTLVFGWLKVIPIVILVALVYALRPAKAPSPSVQPAA